MEDMNIWAVIAEWVMNNGQATLSIVFGALAAGSVTFWVIARKLLLKVVLTPKTIGKIVDAVKSVVDSVIKKFDKADAMEFLVDLEEFLRQSLVMVENKKKELEKIN